MTAQFLGPVDTAFYYVESPTSPMNIGAVSIFEGRIPFDEVLATLDARLYRAPLYRKKVAQAPLSMSQPMWVDDPDFDILHHVQRVQVQAPGDEEALRRTASRLISSTLDRDKPLWEIYVIEGLRGGRTAFLFKIHHAMVDGLSAVELFTLLFDLSSEQLPHEESPNFIPDPPLTIGDLVWQSFKKDFSHKWNVLKKIGGDVGNLASVFSQKEPRRKALVGMANVVNDNLQPIRRLPINGKNSGRQELAWVEFSLAEVRAIKSNHSASINDVMLSVLAGAIERYVRERDPENKQEFLRMLVPVSMRLEQERHGYGNRISVLTIDAQFGFDDPLQRLDSIAEYSRIMKDSSLVNGLDLLLTMPSLLPSMMQPLLWGVAPVAFSVLAHTWCTNVAGPQIPVYFRGHKLVRNYGYFPLNPSMGLACVVLSYNQQISMTLVADEAIVPDVTHLRDYLQECYENLRDAAKVKPIAPILLSHEIPSGAPIAPNIKPVVASNGDHAPEPQEDAIAVAVLEREESAQEADEEEAVLEAVAEAPVEKPKLFTDAWAKAYMGALNNNPAYYKASTGWAAGALALVMLPSPQNDFPQKAAVLLDLYKGQCRNAYALAPDEAIAKAAFVIEGEYNNWMLVLTGKAQPLGMLIRGKLKLAKGSMARLMPFTQSAQELIASAQRI